MTSSFEFWQTQNQWVQLLSLKPQHDSKEEAESYGMMQWVTRELKKRGIEFEYYHLDADMDSLPHVFECLQRDIPDIEWAPLENIARDASQNRFYPFFRQGFGLRFLGLNWCPMLGFSDNPWAQFERFLVTADLPASAILSPLTEQQYQEKMKTWIDPESTETEFCIKKWNKVLTQRASLSIDLPPVSPETTVALLEFKDSSGECQRSMVQIPASFKAWEGGCPEDLEEGGTSPALVDCQRLPLTPSSDLLKEPLSLSIESKAKIKKLQQWAFQNYLNNFTQALHELLHMPKGSDLVYVYTHTDELKCCALPVDLQNEQTQASLLRFSYAKEELRFAEVAFNVFTRDFELWEKIDQYLRLNVGGQSLTSIKTPVVSDAWVKALSALAPEDYADVFQNQGGVFFDTRHFIETFNRQISLSREVKPVVKPELPKAKPAIPRF